MLIDSHGREINYVRIAITDRCNLRCSYCMPEQGLKWIPTKQLMDQNEIIESIHMLAELGVTKVRFTGGEPFLRKDFPQILERTAAMQSIQKISITTNGTLSGQYFDLIKKTRVSGINLSLDTLDANRFQKISRRNDFHVVFQFLEDLIAAQIKTKVNAVVIDGLNHLDILPLAGLAKTYPIDVRFIEEMPFNGRGNSHASKWNFISIIDHLKEAFPEMMRLPYERSSTSYDYTVPGFKGNLGVIAAYSRTFCGTCNRIRLTPQGHLKTCLYDDGALDLKSLIRNRINPEAIKQMIREAAMKKAIDGHEAERLRKPVAESMATIGG
ncbi:MAG: GTP 3',8-cyclase MoaA [Flavobacteriales bacterium]